MIVTHKWVHWRKRNEWVNPISEDDYEIILKKIRDVHICQYSYILHEEQTQW